MLTELLEVPELIKYNIDKFRDNCYIDDSLNVNNISNIKLIASGSSNNASQTGRFIFEELVNIPTTIEYSSEFAHKDYVIGKDTLLIGVSQSGKTADTLAALKKIKADIGCHILCITNVNDSPIYNISDSKILLCAGEEKAVPATKTFSVQLLALFKLAILLAERKNYQLNKLNSITNELNQIPELLLKVFENREKFRELGEKLVKKDHLVILARGVNHPIAKEGALKFKETCYIDANGYPAGEFMHGYMAILDQNVNILTLESTQDEFLRANILKLKQNTESAIYSLTMNTEKTDLFSEYIDIAQTQNKLLSTFVFTSCLHLMTYYGAVSKGYNPDKPRHLKKFLRKE